MMDMKRFSVNRIVSSSLGLADFYDLTASLGLGKVELRNDLGAIDPIDGMKPALARRIADDSGIRVISINALQKFNLASARTKVLRDLAALIELAVGIACPAIVLCPNNEADDGRDALRRSGETAEALASIGPAFEKAGLMGYVEPLGFSVSSLASLVLAQEAIVASGFSCYRIVHDSFHHYIGPDDSAVLGKGYDLSHTGLVHVSGVEADIPAPAMRDAHRVLVGPADRMRNKEQIALLERLGYSGDYSFEPFSDKVTKLGKADLAAALAQSLSYLRS